MLKKLRKNQKGFSSLEAGMTLGLLTSTALIFETKGVTEQRTFDLQLESEAFRYHYHALYNHVKTMRDTLDISTQAGPVTISIADLVSSGSVPASYSPTSNFGASFNGVVTREGPYQFAISTFSTGASGITDSDIGRIAQYAGYHGAGVYSSDTTNFVTQRGMLSEPLSDYTGATVEPAAGSYGLLGYFGVNENAPDYVSRSRSTGGANAMNVQFDMNNNDIINASEFRANGVADGDGIDAAKTTTLTGLSSTHSTGTAATTATASSLALRDSSGRLQVADAVAEEDAVNLRTLLAQSGGSTGACGDNTDPSPGDVCDGLVYIGYTGRTGKKLFVEQNITTFTGSFFPNGYSDKLSREANTLLETCGNNVFEVHEEDFCGDGELITSYVAANSTNSLATTCQNLVSGGYDDWYVPTWSEVAMAFSLLHHVGLPAQNSTQVVLWSSSLFYGSSIWARTLNYSSSSFQSGQTTFSQTGGQGSTNIGFCVRSE